MLPLLYSISEKAGKGRKEPMKMIGVGGGYRMEKEFECRDKGSALKSTESKGRVT